MTGHRMLMTVLFSALVLCAAACGGDAGGVTDSGTAQDAGSTDAGADTCDAGAEDCTGAPDAGSLPSSLEIKYTRPDTANPVTDDEVKTFTLKVMGLIKKIRYFDYLLYTTYGVDASTGMKDWQFWYSENFKKEGDKVTFYHAVNLNDGGHNLHDPFSRVLGDTIAAYLLVGDPTMALAAEKMCKGMSASMLGMVYDASDTLTHLMARNVVAFNHEFLTHDGKKKAVDYSGWFSSYEDWNAHRFPYENNPYWGKVWVTNIRSKDDIPSVFRLIPALRYAVDGAAAQNVRDACGETLALLEAFSKDIVETDYRIRSKDKDGKPFIPGYTDDPVANKNQGDLASYINYRTAIPLGECNARRTAELVGYHHQVKEHCGRGEPNEYDNISFQINEYNKGICRGYHVAHVANSLVNRDDEAAAMLMDGLNERMTQEKALPEDKMRTDPDNYRRSLAQYLAQSDAYGYPLDSDEVRLIHKYYGKAVDEMAQWPYWDPWAASVADGELGGFRPPDCKDDGAGGRLCWFNVEDLGQVFESCWSPFINPAGRRYVDCAIVRDPVQWP